MTRNLCETSITPPKERHNSIRKGAEDRNQSVEAEGSRFELFTKKKQSSLRDTFYVSGFSSF